MRTLLLLPLLLPFVQDPAPSAPSLSWEPSFQEGKQVRLLKFKWVVRSPEAAAAVAYRSPDLAFARLGETELTRFHDSFHPKPTEDQRIERREDNFFGHPLDGVSVSARFVGTEEAEGQLALKGTYQLFTGGEDVPCAGQLAQTTGEWAALAHPQLDAEGLAYRARVQEVPGLVAVLEGPVDRIWEVSLADAEGESYWPEVQVHQPGEARSRWAFGAKEGLPAGTQLLVKWSDKDWNEHSHTVAMPPEGGAPNEGKAGPFSFTVQRDQLPRLEVEQEGSSPAVAGLVLTTSAGADVELTEAGWFAFGSKTTTTYDLAGPPGAAPTLTVNLRKGAEWKTFPLEFEALDIPRDPFR